MAHVVIHPPGVTLRSEVPCAYWQLTKLRELGLATVGDVLLASESKLQTLSYIGEKRSRRIRNAALAAVLEYLSG